MRHFPNWLEAYFSYANDHFCPSKFHEWVGRSVVAGALQRKVSLRQEKITHTPNIYVMLVSHPAAGKSTAIDPGTDLIEALRKEYNPNFSIIPNQGTEAALIKQMTIVERFAIPGVTEMIPHASGYFYASEASSSALQNVFGNYIATLTAFYDCPKFFRKQLAGQDKMTEIENGCVNLLAGATFEYLKTLVNEQTVHGGFASRLIYVVNPEQPFRTITWEDKVVDVNVGLRQKLLEDLAQIHALVGPVTATADFRQAFVKWFPTFDQERINLNSTSLASLLSRKGTNLIKIAIILSAAESNNLTVTQKHFEEAKAIMDKVTEDNRFVLSMAMMSNKESQNGITQFIGNALKKRGGVMKLAELKRLALTNGNPVQMILQTIDFLQGSGTISYDGTNIKLLVDPDAHL